MLQWFPDSHPFLTQPCVGLLVLTNMSARPVLYWLVFLGALLLSNLVVNAQVCSASCTQVHTLMYLGIVLASWLLGQAVLAWTGVKCLCVLVCGSLQAVSTYD